MFTVMALKPWKLFASFPFFSAYFSPTPREYSIHPANTPKNRESSGSDQSVSGSISISPSNAASARISSTISTAATGRAISTPRIAAPPRLPAVPAFFRASFNPRTAALMLPTPSVNSARGASSADAMPPGSRRLCPAIRQKLRFTANSAISSIPAFMSPSDDRANPAKIAAARISSAASYFPGRKPQRSRYQKLHPVRATAPRANPRQKPP